ncbi:MAG: hypothetical protein Q9196_004024 [Gyalolechia fulgens]
MSVPHGTFADHRREWGNKSKLTIVGDLSEVIRAVFVVPIPVRAGPSQPARGVAEKTDGRPVLGLDIFVLVDLRVVRLGACIMDQLPHPVMVELGDRGAWLERDPVGAGGVETFSGLWRRHDVTDDLRLPVDRLVGLVARVAFKVVEIHLAAYAVDMIACHCPRSIILQPLVPAVVQPDVGPRPYLDRIAWVVGGS